MKFVIKVVYTTGDSYGRHTENETLEYEWKDENIALANAKALIEHYNTYRKKEDGRYAGTVDDSFKKKWWYHEPAGHDKWAYSIGIDHSLYLKLDSGKSVLFICPWCGCFESLTSIEVEIKSQVFTPDVW